MQQSEYQMQAYVNNGLVQQHGMDSSEGSKALVHPTKPEVDETDAQKERIMAKYDDVKAISKPVMYENHKKGTLNTVDPMKFHSNRDHRKQ